jgi:NhaP-type Na+/H+ or K+/H+ antiporter
VVTVLEGESLVNDANALVAYRIAVAAVAGGGFVAW